MAQPRDYTRQYNFNDYQTTNPSNPLPGAQVDGELDAVKLTLDDLNANIAKIQRDDGKLDNAAVHKDAFSQDALALINSDFTPRGDWATATAYAVNDAVDFNGATYVATVAHTSSAAFSTDDAADRWILIANAAISGTGSAVDKFEGDGNTTSFTLTYTYTSETAVQVFVNGELLNPVDDYTLSGNTLTLYTAPGLPTVAGNENVIVWGASVVAQAAAQDASGHESNASGYADEAESWATQTTGIVESTDYSSKAYAIGGTGVDTGAGSAKDWATKTSGTVGNTTEYSSKYWATQGNVPIVAQNIADINTVAGISSDVTTVANNDANVTTVAGIDGNVTTVAGISGDVTTVAGNNANVTTLAGLNTQITTLGAISSDISTVSSISANTTTVAGVSTDVTTVAGISGNVSTVAGISSNVTTVALANANVTAIATDLTGTNTIGTTAGSIANVNIVANAITNVNSAAQNMSDINTVATEINNNNLQTVANDIQAVITTANDLNEATSEIDTVANSIANVDLVGGSISNVNTVAANLTDVNAFFDTYAIGATAPSSPTTGDLWFDTSTSTMKVYSGSGFINAGSSVNGTAARFVYTATAAQTTFTGADDGNNTLAYDAGYVDIYMNGVKLAPADYTASNGTSIVLASGAALNDVIEIVAYGTFTLSNLSLNDLTDVSTTGVAEGSLLQYNSTNSQFEPTSATITFSGTTPVINMTDTDTGVDHQINASSGIGNLAINVDTGGEGSNSGLVFRVGGVDSAHEYFRLASNGDARFYDSSNNVLLFVDESGGVVINDSGVDKDFRVESTNRGDMFFVDGGNDRVGIGTVSPQQLLEVRATGVQQAATLRLTGTNASGSASNWVEIDAAYDGVNTSSQMVLSTRDAGTKTNRITIKNSETVINDPSDNHDFRVESNNQSHMLFVDAANDRVGIGEDVPDTLVHAKSSTARFTLESTAADEASIAFITPSGNSYMGQAGANGELVTSSSAGDFVISNRSGGDIHFSADTAYATAQLSIEEGGKILANTTGLLSNHSSGRVQIDGGSQHGLSVITGASSGFAAISCGRNTSGAAVEFHYTNSTNVGKINIDSNGTTYVTNSDRRLKDNIATITDGTEKLMAMNPVTHTWINDPSADAVHGFIAQEMQEIVPEAVSGDPESQDMMSMDYGRITPVLVAALQDAHKKIEALEERLAELEAK